MIEVKIDTEDKQEIYNLPESWDEVTVKQFSKLYKTRNSSNNELMSVVKLIGAMTDIPEGLLLEMDINDFKTLSTKLKFINEEVNKTDIDYIELEGDRYYLYQDFSKLTTGEVITIETIMESVQFDIYNVMGELLCLFLRKKDENGRYEKFSTEFFNRKEMFLEVPVSHIYHVFGFFLNGGSSSESNTKDSTNANNNQATLKEDLQND